MDFENQTFKMNAKLGRELENFIKDLLYSSIRDVQHYDEKYIRDKYKNITAIDHMIQYKRIRILIQDKWKKPGLQDVNHFVQCCQMLQEKEPEYVYCLMYVSKLKPTKNARDVLEHYNTIILVAQNENNLYELGFDVLYSVCYLLFGAEPNFEYNDIMLINNSNTNYMFRVKELYQNLQSNITKINVITKNKFGAFWEGYESILIQPDAKYSHKNIYESSQS